MLDMQAVFAGADAEVAAWGHALLTGQTHAEACRQLRWPKRMAHRVDCRWRRHLRRLAGGREQLTDRVRLDPSQTTALHEFFDPVTQRKLQYWEPITIQ